MRKLANGLRFLKNVEMLTPQKSLVKTGLILHLHKINVSFFVFGSIN